MYETLEIVHTCIFMSDKKLVKPRQRHLQPNMHMIGSTTYMNGLVPHVRQESTNEVRGACVTPGTGSVWFANIIDIQMSVHSTPDCPGPVESRLRCRRFHDGMSEIGFWATRARNQLLI